MFPVRRPWEVVLKKLLIHNRGKIAMKCIACPTKYKDWHQYQPDMGFIQLAGRLMGIKFRPQPS